MCSDTDDGYKSEDDITKTTNRQRMKPWLIEKLNSDKIDGFQWVNKDQKSFRIPWRHGSRHGWNIRRDAGLFEQWAIHSGKYAVGQNADPKKWKANFRCALNSLRDVEELKQDGQKRGSNAFKIYRFLEKRRTRYNVVLSKRQLKKLSTKDEGQKKSSKLHSKPKADINYNIKKKELVGDFSAQQETFQPHNSLISSDNAGVFKDSIKKSIKHHYSGYTLVKQKSDGMVEEDFEEDDQTDESLMPTSSDNDYVPSDHEIVDMILAQEDLVFSEEKYKPICEINMTLEDVKIICSRISSEKQNKF